MSYSYGRSGGGDNFAKIFGGIIVIGVALLVCGAPHLDRDTITAKVEKSERIRSHDKDKYMVFTDKEVLENTDSLIEGKWNSSDIYAGIKSGNCYRFEVYGWRWTFASWYRNIVSATEVECK